MQRWSHSSLRPLREKICGGNHPQIGPDARRRVVERPIQPGIASRAAKTDVRKVQCHHGMCWGAIMSHDCRNNREMGRRLQ
eukprot:scaffold100531_cov29-Tisochrysis_lutea.AAC.4